MSEGQIKAMYNVDMYDNYLQQLNVVSKSSRLRLQNTQTVSLRGKSPPQNECAGYDTKLSDIEAPVLELKRVRSIPSVPLLPGSLYTAVVASDRIPSKGQIELFNYLNVRKQMIDDKLNC